MASKKHIIGEIEFIKGGLSFTSESFFPKYFTKFWIVTIPLLKSEIKKGNYTTGITFFNEEDAKTFSEFLKGHLKKYIRELKEDFA